MKTIFQNSNVRVEVSEHNTVETVTVGVNTNRNQALFSLACEVKRLQEKLGEAHTRITNGLEALDSENFEDIPYNVSCALNGSES